MIEKGINDIATTKQCEPKWKGQASAKLAGLNSEQVWPLLAGFCSLNQWFPTLKTCISCRSFGSTRCVRYCAGFKTHKNHGEKNHVNWTKQKLLSINPDEMTFSYSIIDSNVGFNSYVSKVRVLAEGDGCVIEWDYEVEPPVGWKKEDLDSFIGNGLKVMAEKMKEALKASIGNRGGRGQPIHVKP